MPPRWDDLEEFDYQPEVVRLLEGVERMPGQLWANKGHMLLLIEHVENDNWLCWTNWEGGVPALGPAIAEYCLSAYEHVGGFELVSEMP